METITEATRAAMTRRPSMPLPSALPASGFPALVEPLAGRPGTEGRSTGIRVRDPHGACERARFHGSGASKVSTIPSPIAAYVTPSTAFAAGEPISAAAQFRTQGLSVTSVPVTNVARGSADTGVVGIGMQQGTGVIAASALNKLQGAARGVPPRGRPDC